MNINAHITYKTDIPTCKANQLAFEPIYQFSVALLKVIMEFCWYLPYK